MCLVYDDGAFSTQPTSKEAELLAALKALRADHAMTEPHHEDMCALCMQADMAISKAEGKR